MLNATCEFSITKFNVQHKKVINLEIFFTLLHVSRLLLFLFVLLSTNII